MNRYLISGCKMVILINGILVLGKSIIICLLVEIFSLLVLMIDGIKELFMVCLVFVDWLMNCQLGCVVYEVIWLIVGVLFVSMVWLIDVWFGFQLWEILQRLLQQVGVEQVIEVWNYIFLELVVVCYVLWLVMWLLGYFGEEYLLELVQLVGWVQFMLLGFVLMIDQWYLL